MLWWPSFGSEHTELQISSKRSQACFIDAGPMKRGWRSNSCCCCRPSFWNIHKHLLLGSPACGPIYIGLAFGSLVSSVIDAFLIYLWKMCFFSNTFLRLTYLFLKAVVDIKMCIFKIFLAGFYIHYTGLILTMLLWVAFNSWSYCIYFASAEVADMNYCAQMFCLLWRQSCYVVQHSFSSPEPGN